MLSADSAAPAATDRAFGCLLSRRFGVVPRGYAVDVSFESMSALAA